MDYFSNLIDSRIAQQTKNQFMKTQPATVINNGSVDQMKVVRLLATGATAELLNMTGVDLSVGDQVQVYSCGKTMYIGASSNTATGTIYTAGDNITISAENVISSHDTTYTAGENISISPENAINSWHQAHRLLNEYVSGTTTTGYTFTIDIAGHFGTTLSGVLAHLYITQPYKNFPNVARSLTFFIGVPTIIGGGALSGGEAYAYVPAYFDNDGTDDYQFSSITAYMYRSSETELTLFIEPVYYLLNGSAAKTYYQMRIDAYTTVAFFN